MNRRRIRQAIQERHVVHPQSWKVLTITIITSPRLSPSKQVGAWTHREMNELITQHSLARAQRAASCRVMRKGAFFESLHRFKNVLKYQDAHYFYYGKEGGEKSQSQSQQESAPPASPPPPPPPSSSSLRQDASQQESAPFTGPPPLPSSSPPRQDDDIIAAPLFPSSSFIQMMGGGSSPPSQHNSARGVHLSLRNYPATQVGGSARGGSTSGMGTQNSVPFFLTMSAGSQFGGDLLSTQASTCGKRKGAREAEGGEGQEDDDDQKLSASQEEAAASYPPEDDEDVSLPIPTSTISIPRTQVFPDERKLGVVLEALAEELRRLRDNDQEWSCQYMERAMALDFLQQDRLEYTVVENRLRRPQATDPHIAEFYDKTIHNLLLSAKLPVGSRLVGISDTVMVDVCLIIQNHGNTQDFAS